MKHKLSLAISGLSAILLVSVSSFAVADKSEGRLFNKNNNQPSVLKKVGNNNNGSGNKPGNGIFKKNNQNNNKVIVNKNNNNRVIVNKNNNNKVIVNKNNNKHQPVIIKPAPKPIIVKPAPKPIIVKPAPKPIVVQPVRGPFFRPIMPGWKNWHGGKVVIVDNHHTHFNAFAFVMTTMAVAIVIDQSNDKPYTESGKPVTVKERSCGKNDETEVIELDNELLVITCK